jgi:L,D-peptidoglycan transpeptidase YkuD (ErfK/YbiS/YcfS/YnhG family)
VLAAPPAQATATAPPATATAPPATATPAQATATPAQATATAPPAAATPAQAAVTATPAATAPSSVLQGGGNLRATRTLGQIITVTASYGSTYATLTAYNITSSGWVEEFGPWTARVGYNGIAAPGTKREGDGKTPSGTYGFSFFFGVLPNPGVSFPYRNVYSYDYWDDDPLSPLYNEWVDTRTQDPGSNPEPMDNVPAYNYGAVIAYNTARTPGLGSAIFLHVDTGESTAGCVSLPQSELLEVLTWLNPADNPVIQITGV